MAEQPTRGTQQQQDANKPADANPQPRGSAGERPDGRPQKDDPSLAPESGDRKATG